MPDGCNEATNGGAVTGPPITSEAWSKLADAVEQCKRAALSALDALTVSLLHRVRMYGIVSLQHL